MQRTLLSVLPLVALAVSCASGPPTYKWVNEVNPKAYYQRDYYECDKEAKAEEVLPAANIAGSVALGMNIVRRRSECLAARGWKSVPIAAEGSSLATPDLAAVPVDVLSDPAGGEVYVDGTFVGTTPLRNFRLSAGTHHVEVRRTGYTDWARQLLVQAGTPVTLRATLTPST